MYPFPCPQLRCESLRMEPKSCRIQQQKAPHKKQLQTPLQKLQQQQLQVDDNEGTGEAATTSAADKIEEAAKTSM